MSSMHYMHMLNVLQWLLCVGGSMQSAGLGKLEAVLAA
jgi:hypothetical protein